MITYPVVQHESISCVPPPDESVATPVAPRPLKMKTPEPPLKSSTRLESSGWVHGISSVTSRRRRVAECHGIVFNRCQ